MNMKQEEIYVGIDVAKDRVDVAIRPGGDQWNVNYDERGVGRACVLPTDCRTRRGAAGGNWWP